MIQNIFSEHHGIKLEVYNRNENEHTTAQNLWDTEEAVLRWKFIAIQAYLKKIEKIHMNNLTPTSTRTGGPTSKAQDE